VADKTPFLGARSCGEDGIIGRGKEEGEGLRSENGEWVGDGERERVVSG
jgi:hypothetical protein